MRLALLATLCFPLCAATYYVDCAAANDTGDGTTTGTAWKTLAKVNASTLAAGDSVLFAKGCAWRETLTPGQSGSAGSPITFGAYGSGALPIIDAANLTTWTNSSGNVWYATATADPVLPAFGAIPGVNVVSLVAVIAPYQYFFDSGANRVYVYSVGTPASTVEIPTRNTAVYVSGKSFLKFDSLVFRGGKGDGGFGAYNASHDITITNCLAELNANNGIWFYDATNAQDNGIVSRCIARNNGSSGIDINSDMHANWNITSNTVYQNGLVGLGLDTAYNAGIKMFTYSGLGGAGSVIAGNRVYNNGGTGATTANGVGIWLDSPTGVTVAHNYVYGNSSYGIFLEKTTNCTASYNTVVNNSLAALQYGANFAMYGSGVSGAGADAAYISQGNLIEYNTIYSTSGSWWGLKLGVNLGSGAAISRNNTVRNNIVIGASHETVYFDYGADNDGNGGGNVYLNNTFGTAAANMFNWAQTNYSTYAAWEAQYCGSTGCSHSLQTSPTFVNAATLDLRLPRGSAASTSSTTGGSIGAQGMVGPSAVTGTTAATGHGTAQ